MAAACQDLAPKMQGEQRNVSVDDAMPLSEFHQSALVLMNYRYFRVALPGDVDRGRLLRACQQLVDRHAILRTVFVPDQGEIVQKVLAQWHVSVREYEVTDLDRHCSRDGAVAESPTSGKPPFAVQLVTVDGTGDMFLVFRLGNVLFDGLSLYILVDDLSTIYNGRRLLPTSPFAEHLRAATGRRTDAAYETWRRVLRGSSMTSLLHHRLPPSLGEETASPAYLVKAAKTIARVSPPTGITLSTALKAAWAVTLLRHFPPETHCAEGSRNVVFGQVVHGRGLDVPYEDRIVGPCISINPVRVSFGQSVSKMELLHNVQHQLVETMPFAALGYQDIVRNCTHWPRDTPMASYVRIGNYEITPSCWLD